MDINSQSFRKNESNLFRAIERKDLKKVTLLLAQGVNPNATYSSDYRGNITALMSAAGCQFLEAVELLLKAGADTNMKTVAGAGAHGGATALHEAIEGSDTRLPEDDPEVRKRIVTKLLKAEADPNAIDEVNRTPLNLAASDGYLEIVKRLVLAGADVSGQPMPPLRDAAGNGHLEIAEFLVQSGAKIDEEGPDQLTPLSVAAFQGAEKMVNWLLEHKANPNHRSKDGRTPLINAARHAARARTENQHQVGLRIVKRLIEAGADPCAKDAEGRTPLDFVRDGESPLVANCLKEVVKAKRKR